MQMLGHKADLMFICFRRGFEQLAQCAARAVAHRAERISGSDDVVCVDRRARHVRDDRQAPRAARRALKPGSEAFERAFDAEMETQRQRS